MGATLWAPYIAHYGWPGQRDLQDSFTEAAIKNALLAAHQVFFVSDILTNAVICGDVQAVLEMAHDVSHIAAGQRLTVSADLGRFATLQKVYSLGLGGLIGS